MTPQESSALTSREQLQARVVVNRQAEIVEKHEMYWRLRVKLRHSRLARLYAKFFPLRNHHDYILDGVGLAIFRKIAEAPAQQPVVVGDMLREFIREHRLFFYEGKALVVYYLGRLMRAGLVVVEAGKAAEETQG